jgi:hypothetical protein
MPCDFKIPSALAVCRFISAAAAGAITGYDHPGLYECPASWFRSDIDFDIIRGDLYLRGDRRLPWRRGLRFYAQGDAPALAVDRAARQLGDVKAAILAALAEHAADFVGMPTAERVAILSEILPFPHATVRTVVYRSLAVSRL